MTKVIIKSEEEQVLMRQAGYLLTRVFDMLDDLVRPGISTMAINDAVETFIVKELRSRPASKGQYGYRYVLNVSINEEVCHGMPSARRRLKPRDIVNLDITLEKDGYISDSSKMYVLPGAPVKARRLVKATYDAMWQGIQVVRPGARLGDVGHAIQSYAESAGYSVVREYCGHGIGREMHEAPQVLHYGRPNTGLVLKPGMVFTIEPMINQGGRQVKTLKDGWTVVTRDRSLSAQWEHTVLVTDEGYEVLTLRADEQ